MLTLELPFPPSLNHYYRHIGHATLISRRGRAYRDTVIKQLKRLRLKPLLGPLDLELELYPPDRRRRDADNFQKCLVDSIQHAGVFKDDSQFVHIQVWKLAPIAGGKAVVRIKELADAEDVRPDQSPATLHLQPDRSHRRHRGVGVGLPPGKRRQVRGPRGPQRKSA